MERNGARENDDNRFIGGRDSVVEGLKIKIYGNNRKQASENTQRPYPFCVVEACRYSLKSVKILNLDQEPIPALQHESNGGGLCVLDQVWFDKTGLAKKIKRRYRNSGKRPWVTGPGYRHEQKYRKVFVD